MNFQFINSRIEFPDVDKGSNYHAGGKSLMALGFISREKIPYAQLLGDGSMIFYPVKDDPVSRSINNLWNYRHEQPNSGSHNSSN